MAVPADKVVMTSALVTLTSTVAASIMPKDLGGQGELPGFRLLVGSSLTFMGLGIMADFAPALAGPIATSIAVTAAIYYGFPILNNYTNATPDTLPDQPKDMTDDEG
jgi:hypothetical protein